MSPRLLLRLEGAALAGAAAVVYLDRDYSLLLAVVLVLAPDLAFLGYLAGPRIGAAAYNAAHTSVGPLILGAAGFVGDSRLALELALIWLFHIGVDRAIGYGLKYPSAFKDTHLQRV